MQLAEQVVADRLRPDRGLHLLEHLQIAGLRVDQRDLLSVLRLVRLREVRVLQQVLVLLHLLLYLLLHLLVLAIEIDELLRLELLDLRLRPLFEYDVR